jgi:hypothetical protein
LIQVKVRIILTLREILGRGDLELTMKNRSTVNDVLISMVETYGRPLAGELYDSNARESARIEIDKKGGFFERPSGNNFFVEKLSAIK